LITVVVLLTFTWSVKTLIIKVADLVVIPRCAVSDFVDKVVESIENLVRQVGYLVCIDRVDQLLSEGLSTRETASRGF
jgi:hypothetical protein